MSQNIHNITPLNWQSLVTEAIRRRKDLKLNQKSHAALAGVSIPTMFSFEKSETTISLAKALNILNVVGLVSKQNEATDPLSKFAEAAEAKWFKLIQDLPKDSPIRHPHGYYTYTYEITDNSGIFKTMSLDKLMDLIKQVSKTKHNSWPPFWIPTNREEIKPYTYDNHLIECWHKNSIFQDAEHSDFWQAQLEKPNKLYMHLHRGYRDDDDLNPGTKFDVNRLMITTSAIMLHAVHISNIIAKDPNGTTIKLKTKYNGLSNRTLSSKDMHFNTTVCKQDSIDLSISFKSSDLSEPLAENDNFTKILHILLADLHSQLDF